MDTILKGTCWPYRVYGGAKNAASEGKPAPSIAVICRNTLPLH